MSEKTVIIGGGTVGCELAIWLASKGTAVTIVEAEQELLAVGGPLYRANSGMLKILVDYRGVETKFGEQVTGYNNGTLTLANGDTLAADTVILAVGYQENDSLFKELEQHVDEIYLLGDARKVSNIHYAIWDAFEIASNI